MGRWPLIQLADDSILFADDDLIAVDKAPGVLCDASIDPERDHLGKALQRWSGEDAELHPVHRLDLATSGVVLFARTSEATTAVMRQFQERTVSKQYQAIVRRPDDAAWVVGHAIDRRSYLRHRKGMSEEVRSGGKPAESDFVVLEVDGPLALVRAMPKTGRTHQLRVHLAALDAPIVGDDRYGLGESDRLWLHADTLTVTHPTTEEPLTIRSRRQLHLAGGTATEMSHL